MAFLTDAQIIKAFGQPGNPDNFTIIQLPYPMRIAWDLKTQVHKMQCHELAEHRFLSVFNDLLTHYGLAELQRLGIDIFGGCVNVRTMRGSKTKWSRHSWGIDMVVFLKQCDCVLGAVPQKGRKANSKKIVGKAKSRQPTKSTRGNSSAFTFDEALEHLCDKHREFLSAFSGVYA